MTFVFVLVGWIFSLCLHEFAHAAVAYLGGDTSVREKGYLTFNPLRYVDPVTSLVIPLAFLLLGGIGLPGGAVYIDRSRLRSKYWECAVALAGPAANLVVAGVLVLALGADVLPVPPLDGYGAIAPFLPRNLRMTFGRWGSISLWILLAVLWFVPAASAW